MLARFALVLPFLLGLNSADALAKDGKKQMVAISQERPLRLLIGTSGLSPYSETASGDTLSIINAAVLGQLLSTDANFNLKSNLIENWRWDFEKKAYVLKLKDGLRFHNGRVVTSKDLEFSLLRGFFSNHRSFYYIYLGNIDGIDEAAKHDRFVSGVVKGVKIIGPQTVEIKLKEPNPSFLHSLVNPYFSLVPIEELNEDYITWKKFPIGCGPYKVVKGFVSGKVILQRVSQDLVSSPAFVELYTKPEGTLFDVSIYSYEGMPPNLESKQTALPASVTTLFFSNQNELASYPEFRHAVALAINRTALAKGMKDYRPTLELLPAHFWGREGIDDPYNPEKAKQLLAHVPEQLLQREWRVPAFSGAKFTPEASEIYSRIEKQLKDVGIKIKIYPNQEKFISKETAKHSPISISGRVSDYVDPLIMFASFRPESAYEFERPLSDPQFMELYRAAARSQEKDDRVKTVRELSEYVNNNAIAVPILERYVTQFYDPKLISSLGDQNQPLTLFIDRMSLRTGKPK